MKKFSTLKFQFSNPLGLTLVEILLILSILVIILALVWALLDPFEQNKKTSDVLLRNTTSEFLQGTVRYNANVSSNFPWNSTSCLVQGGATALITPVPLSSLSTCISSMDFKSSFSATPQSVLRNVYLNQPNPLLTPAESSSLLVCYLPQSQSAQKDSQAKYLRNGYVAPSGLPSVNGYDLKGNALSTGSCMSSGGSNYCYVCISN